MIKKIAVCAAIVIFANLFSFGAVIRVLLADNLSSAAISSVSGIKILVGEAYITLTEKSSPITVTPYQNKLMYTCEDKTVDSGGTSFVFAPLSGGLKDDEAPLIKADINPAKKYNTYRGAIEVHINKDGKIMLINKVDLDEYLYSVVAAEIGSSQPDEALKTQAVAARSYAAAKIGRYLTQKFDVYDTVMSQVYNGYLYETSSTVKAVKDTLNEVLYDKNNKIVDAMFFSTCGGFTETASNGAHYLVSVNDCGAERPKNEEEWKKYYTGSFDGNCNHPNTSFAAHYRWTKTFTFAEFTEKFPQKTTTGNVIGFNILKREPGGRVSSLEVVGTLGKITINGDSNIRKLFFDLKSSGIVIVSSNDKNSFTIYGAGYGHGLGMCQVGAIGQAKKGRDYKEILLSYYQGAVIKQF